MNHRVLIAGCGDLGLRIARVLQNNSSTEVWGLRRHPDVSSQEDSLRWLAADLSRSETLTSMPQNITHLVFCAAPGQRTEKDYQEVYVKGLQNIVQAIANPDLKRIVFVSSTAVYGDHGDSWIDENTPVFPKAFNGKVLIEAEEWLKSLNSSEHAYLTVSLRLSGIYGPGRNYLLDRLRKGLVSAPADRSHWVNRIHIDDAAAAVVHILALREPEPVYLVTDSTPLPMRTLYEDLAKLVGGPIPEIGPAPATVGSKRLSNARLLASGFHLSWPDSRIGHQAQVEEDTSG